MNLGRNTENVGNQGSNAGKDVNLSIAVGITCNSNGNDKLKYGREVKIINVLSRILLVAFLVNFGHI